MNLSIRIKLTIQFAFIVMFILIFFSGSVYYFSSEFRQAEFYTRLENKALNTAKLLFEVKEVDYDLLKIIDRNTINSLYKEKIVIFDFNGKQIYNSIDDDTLDLDPVLFEKVRLENHVRFQEGDKEALGMTYEDANGKYIAVISAFDRYGRSKLQNLKWILIIGFFVSMGLTIFFGRIYSRRALFPISNVINQVDRITISSLNLRVNEGDQDDEIAQLSFTFNKMLERLESAFEMQRSFVSNASHELRTPLTSITGQIEVSLMKPRSKEEYEEILQSVLEDIKNLNELSNGLLDMAKANSDISGFALRDLRIDQLIWEARMELSSRKKRCKIDILFVDEIEDEKKLTFEGNEHLIKVAIINLMDNGCKYSSDSKVDVRLSLDASCIIVEFVDHGIGMDEEDLKGIFQPFFRAKNTTAIPGNGLGLTLTEKIVKLHKGSVSIASEIDLGTTVTLRLPFKT